MATRPDRGRCRCRSVRAGTGLVAAGQGGDEGVVQRRRLDRLDEERAIVLGRAVVRPERRQDDDRRVARRPASRGARWPGRCRPAPACAGPARPGRTPGRPATHASASVDEAVASAAIPQRSSSVPTMRRLVALSSTTSARRPSRSTSRARRGDGSRVGRGVRLEGEPEDAALAGDPGALGASGRRPSARPAGG